MRAIMLRFLSCVLFVASFASAQTNSGSASGSPRTGPPPGGDGKRPMTFEDMMAMKRLGDTAVSSDGKWLAYAATSVNLDQNTMTAQLFIQPIDSGNTKPPAAVAVAQPNDSGIQFSSDNKHILFLSSREDGQQIWLADFDTATGATSNAKKLTHLSTEADNARW